MTTIMSDIDVSLMCADGEKTGGANIYVVVERGSLSRLPKRSEWKKKGGSKKVGKGLELVEDGGASMPPSKKARTPRKGQHRKLLSHRRYL